VNAQANLMTGLINVTLETMYASDFVAVLVLSGYAASLVGCAWAFRTKRVVKLS
jgi:phosphatidylinositol glycan class W